MAELAHQAVVIHDEDVYTLPGQGMHEIAPVHTR
jgi:hypothetical protein